MFGCRYWNLIDFDHYVIGSGSSANRHDVIARFDRSKKDAIFCRARASDREMHRRPVIEDHRQFNRLTAGRCPVALVAFNGDSGNDFALGRCGEWG